MIGRILSGRTRLPLLLRRHALQSGRNARCFGAGRRFSPASFRSASAVESEKKLQRDSILATTNRLLKDVELGSLVNDDWAEGQTALEFWTTQNSREKEVLDHSCDLLERMLEEREDVRSRLEKLVGGSGASAVLDHCCALDSTEIMRRIVTQHYSRHSSEDAVALDEDDCNNKILPWVTKIMERFDVNPCDEVLSLLKLERTSAAKRRQQTAAEPKSQPNLSENKQPTPSKLETKQLERTSAAKGRLQTAAEPKSQPTWSENKQPTPSKLEAMTESEDKQLAGSILLAFVRSCDAAGIDSEDTEKRVGEYMKGRHNSTNEEESKSKRAFLFALKSWLELAPEHPEIAAKQAETLLYEMVTTYLKKKNLDVKPCHQCFSSVISIHSGRGDAEAADRVLQLMLLLHERSGDEGFLPSRQDFLTVLLSLFIGKNNKEAMYQSDNALRQMLDLAAAKKDPLLLPPQSVFQHMLTLWSRSYKKDAGERAEAILLRFQEVQDGNHLNNSLPPLNFFELVLQSWANSHVGKKAAARVENILSLVRKRFGAEGETLPPSFGYLQLILVWSRCSQEPLHAIDNVEKYFREFTNHFGSNSVSGLDIIVAYKARISAWLLCPDALKGATMSQAAFDDLMILRKKELISRDPDSTVYGLVAHAWAKTGNTALVKATLNQMSREIGQSPDNIMHNYLFLSLARSKDPRAGEQAEELLFELEKLSGSGDLRVKPNIRTYGMVMQALSNSPDPETASRAELYLQRLKEMYEASGDEDLKPNTKIYTTAIRSMVNQSSQEAVEKAQDLLNEMHDRAEKGDQTVKPDKVTYTTFLKLLRTADVPNKSERARGIVSLMRRNGIQPDSRVDAEMRKLI